MRTLGPSTPGGHPETNMQTSTSHSTCGAISGTSQRRELWCLPVVAKIKPPGYSRWVYYSHAAILRNSGLSLYGVGFGRLDIPLPQPLSLIPHRVCKPARRVTNAHLQSTARTSSQLQRSRSGLLPMVSADPLVPPYP